MTQTRPTTARLRTRAMVRTSPTSGFFDALTGERVRLIRYPEHNTIGLSQLAILPC